MYIYIFIYVWPIFHHTPKVRNKTSYEAPSFHTSGTPRNVPYTILTRDHLSIHSPIHLSIHVYTCLFLRQASAAAWTSSWKRKWDRDWHQPHSYGQRKTLSTQ